MVIRPWLMCCNKEGTMAQKKVNAVIHSQEKLAEGIYSMWLDAPEMAEAAVPGQVIAVLQNGTVFILIHKKRKQTPSASDQYL
mgnify:CR=1 FL=1